MRTTIPGRDVVSLLEYEASRRPEIAHLVALARVADLSDAEIARAQVPLPWYRYALTTIRDQARVAQLAASIEPHIQSGTVADPVGSICEYRGETFFTNQSFMVEVPTGKLVFLPDSGGVWMDHTFYPECDRRLLEGTMAIERGNRDRYFDLRRERLLRLHGDAPVIDMTGGRGAAPSGRHQSEAVSRLGALGVTFR